MCRDVVRHEHQALHHSLQIHAKATTILPYLFTSLLENFSKHKLKFLHFFQQFICPRTFFPVFPNPSKRATSQSPMHVCFVSHILEFRRYSVGEQQQQIRGQEEKCSRLRFWSASDLDVYLPAGSTWIHHKHLKLSKSSVIFPSPTKPPWLSASFLCGDHTIPPITGLLKLRTLLGLLFPSSIRPALGLRDRRPGCESRLYHLAT